MKPRRKPLLLASIFFGVALALITMAYKFPLVLQLSKKPKTSPILFREGVLNPLSKLDLESGEWTAYLHIAAADIPKLPRDLAKFPCLMTTDTSLLERMKKSWNMIPQGGDMATVTSSILIYKDGKLEFESGIVLTENSAGLQSPAYGWMTPADVQDFLAPLKEFAKLHRPLIVL